MKLESEDSAGIKNDGDLGPPLNVESRLARL